jgi:hypothetical protein
MRPRHQWNIVGTATHRRRTISSGRVTVPAPEAKNDLRSNLDPTRSIDGRTIKEISMKTKVVSGASLAAATIALVLNGAAPSTALAKAARKPVHCAGINSCKGMSACKTANSSCKGMNSCKGQGWIPAKSAKACEAKGGTIAEM